MKPVLGLLTALAVTSVTAVTASAEAAAFSIQFIEKPGATITQPFDINNQGVVVGNSDVGGFVFDGTTFTDLPVPDGYRSILAGGISDDGVIVGQAESEQGGFQGFLFDGTDYTFVGSATEQLSFRGISPDGRYVSGTKPDPQTGLVIGVVYDTVDGSITTLDVSGNLDPNTAQTIIPQGINASYQLVGSRSILDSATGSIVQDAFVYDLTDDTLTTFTVDGADVQRTAARDINASGDIAGFFLTSSGISPFLETSTGVMRLDSIATNALLQGINDDGVMVGSSLDTGQGFIITPSEVPLPAALPLFAAGLFGLGVSARRRRSA